MNGGRDVLTPREIHEMEFTRVFRGYEPEEVDAFVERVVKGYEALYQENRDLKAHIKEAEKELESNREHFVYTDEAIKLAKQAGDDARRAAEQQAEAIIQLAETKAAEIVAAAERETASMRRRVAWLQNEESRFRQRLQRLFAEGLELLEQVPAAATDGLEAPSTPDPRTGEVAVTKEP